MAHPFVFIIFFVGFTSFSSEVSGDFAPLIGVPFEDKPHFYYQKTQRVAFFSLKVCFFAKEQIFLHYQKTKLVATFSNMIIQRDNYLKRLIVAKGNRMIKIITGIRRCGKSFLLFELFHNHLISEGVDDSHIIEIALDDRLNIEYRNPDKLLAYIKCKIVDNKQYYVLLDEIQ